LTGKYSKSYIAITIFTIGLLTIFFSRIYGLPTQVQNDESKLLSFGSIIKPLGLTDVMHNKVLCPEENKVNVLIFFNIEFGAHQRTLFKIDQLHKRMIGTSQPVKFFGISQGKPDQFLQAAKQYDLKVNLIDDKDNIVHTYFSFTCDQCIRVIIIDKTQTLRYDATYINLNMIEQIVLRYCKLVPERSNK
jgi:hypothetical protein